MKLTIGPIKLKSPVILAPMADVSDLPFRLICREQGAALAYTPMLYTSQLLHENKPAQNLIKTTKKDKPLGIQITGSSLREFKQIIPKLNPFDLVDINCGCPSSRLINNQAGSYLLNSPEKISKIIKLLKSENLTVTAKIRLGFEKPNVFKIAKAIEKAGADALTLHPRLATQGNSIPANHEYTKKLSQKIGIPLIANGDIFTPEKARELLDFADGVMIARAALSNPSIFKQILSPNFKITQQQNLKLFQKYLYQSQKHKTFDIGRTKYIGSNIISNFPCAARQRQKFMQLKTQEQIQNFIRELKI